MPCGSCFSADKPGLLPDVEQVLLGLRVAHVIYYRVRMQIICIRETEDGRQILAEGLLKRGHDTLLVEPLAGAGGRSKQGQRLSRK